MAAVSEIITLGVGTPSSIPYLVLTGLGIGASGGASPKNLLLLGVG